jgi:hypothetical protein
VPGYYKIRDKLLTAHVAAIHHSWENSQLGDITICQSFILYHLRTLLATGLKLTSRSSQHVYGLQTWCRSVLLRVCVNMPHCPPKCCAGMQYCFVCKRGARAVVRYTVIFVCNLATKLYRTINTAFIGKVVSPILALLYFSNRENFFYATIKYPVICHTYSWGFTLFVDLSFTAVNHYKHIYKYVPEKKSGIYREHRTTYLPNSVCASDTKPCLFQGPIDRIIPF